LHVEATRYSTLSRACLGPYNFVADVKKLEQAAAEMSERKGFKERTLDYTEADKAWVRIKKLNSFQVTPLDTLL
jgi:hypothetical protein